MIDVETLLYIQQLESKIDWLLKQDKPNGLTALTTPLTSTNWDGDNYSTTAVTLLDLSAEFGIPAGVRAIDVQIEADDSVAAISNVPYFAIGPSATYYYAINVYPIGDGIYSVNHGICPCDANGDIYYRIIASGTNTLSCWIRIWGYYI